VVDDRRDLRLIEDRRLAMRPLIRRAEGHAPGAEVEVDRGRTDADERRPGGRPLPLRPVTARAVLEVQARAAAGDRLAARFRTGCRRGARQGQRGEAAEHEREGGDESGGAGQAVPRSRTVRPMETVHAWLAWLAAGSLVAVLVTAAATALGRPSSYRALDLVLLAQLALTGLAGVAGAATAASGRPPADPLHLLYGLLAAVVPVGVRAAAQGRTARSVARWVAVAALVALGGAVRSFMTGS
jgi:hypothetical protein